MEMNDMNMEGLGLDAISTRVRARLKARRELLDIKQQTLGLLLPDPPKQWFIGRIELGEIRLPSARLVQLAHILRVPTAWLLGVDEYTTITDDDPYLNIHATAQMMLGPQYEQLVGALTEDEAATEVVLKSVVTKRIENEGVNYGSTSAPLVGEQSRTSISP